MGKLFTKNSELLPLPSLMINLKLCYSSQPTKRQYSKQKNTRLTMLLV